MTGQLRNFTGAAIKADHERRIRELERKLNASQVDLSRRATGVAMPSIFASHDPGQVVAVGGSLDIAWTVPPIGPPAPFDTAHNIGGAFSLTSPSVDEIVVSADCLIDVTVRTHVLSIGGSGSFTVWLSLAGTQWGTVEDYRTYLTGQPATPSLTLQNVRCTAGAVLTATLDHDDVDPLSLLDASFSARRVRLL